MVIIKVKAAFVKEIVTAPAINPISARGDRSLLIK